MTIASSDIASKIVKQKQSNVGTVHFLKHLAVIEFNEGTHIDLNAVRKTLNDLIEHFGCTRPFGIKRIHKL